MTIKTPAIVENDPWLAPYAEIIYRRQIKGLSKRKRNLPEMIKTYRILHRISVFWVAPYRKGMGIQGMGPQCHERFTW